jgi:hypothetical protein
VNYIYWFENKRRNSITTTRAAEIFEIIRQQSYHAEKEGRHDEVWIKYDTTTGEWRGRECATHREGYGLERRGARGKQAEGNTLRDRFGWIGNGGLTRSEFEDVIAATDSLIEPEARNRFNTLKTMDIVRFCRVTRLWYGFAADPPNLKTKPIAVSKAQEYRRRYGRMPELTHDWQGSEGSEHIKWIIATEYAAGNEIGTEEAEKIRRRVWKSEGIWKVCGQTEDRKNRICGVDAGLPEGEYATEKAKPLPKVHRWVEDSETDYIEGKKVPGDVISELWDMPPLEPFEAIEWMCAKVGFRFDALRMMKEEPKDFPFENGKYRGNFYKSPEEIAEIEERKREMLRQETEKKEREEREKREKFLARIKVKNLDELITKLSPEPFAVRSGETTYRKPSNYHTQACSYMPHMKTGAEAYEWFGETFGLERENDCVDAFQLAFDERFIVAKYDGDGRLEHFRGTAKPEWKTKTPAA